MGLKAQAAAHAALAIPGAAEHAEPSISAAKAYTQVLDTDRSIFRDRHPDPCRIHIHAISLGMGFLAEELESCSQGGGRILTEVRKNPSMSERRPYILGTCDRLYHECCHPELKPRRKESGYRSQCS